MVGIYHLVIYCNSSRNNTKLSKEIENKKVGYLMKVYHNTFDGILAIKGITKKAYETYVDIPYFTLAGWKKSSSLPTYARWC